MPSTKEIRGRIKSVKNTRKITRAMELISTVKMKKAQDAALGARPFALTVSRLFSRISSVFLKHPLFCTPKGSKTKTLYVVFSANKGLCGAYNVNAFREITPILKHQKEHADFVVIGRKVRDFVARSGGTIVADFSDTIKDVVDARETKKISRTLQKMFLEGSYEKVEVIYSWLVSAISQRVVHFPILPLHKDTLQKFLEDVVQDANLVQDIPEYTFEPSPLEIANIIVPMCLDHILHENALEAKASEHAARMVAMKSAKDNAGKKASLLTLIYNKARQGAITKEITEIVSGVESIKE